jgi:hypothetical protein
MEDEGFDAMRKIVKYLEDIMNYELVDALSVIKKTTGNRSKYFDRMRFDAGEVIDNMSLRKMLRDGLLYEMAPKEYVVTLKFLIIRECIDDSKLDIWRFIDRINEEYFLSLYDKRNQPLAGDEKAIILALMGLMSFTEDSAFKADSEQKASAFRKCVERCAEFLRECSYSDSSLHNVWSIKARGENEVQAKLARLSDVVTKTSNIYKKDRKDGHFIDILTGENINRPSFNELMKKIFNKGPLTLVQKDRLIDTLAQIERERSEVLTNPIPVNPKTKVELYRSIREWIFE